LTTLTILAASANPSPVSTTTSLASSDSSAEWSEAVTFTATVTTAATSSQVAGAVEFYDGSTDLGSGALNSSGQAGYTLTTLTAGTHAITATFSGDTDSNSRWKPAWSDCRGNIAGRAPLPTPWDR
jgi:Bacterial Ig-like domain (group 3)